MGGNCSTACNNLMKENQLLEFNDYLYQQPKPQKLESGTASPLTTTVSEFSGGNMMFARRQSHNNSDSNNSHQFNHFKDPSMQSLSHGTESLQAIPNIRKKKTVACITRMITKADKTLKLIVKIQSLWRAYKIRRQLRGYRESQVGDKNNQSEREFWETISASKLYNPQEQRVKRKYRYDCSEAIYEGDWKGGFRDGFGVMLWKDGSKYEGYWRDGRAQGHGKQTYKNGDIYEGDWQRGKAQGQGILLTKIDGGIYKGEWKNDTQEGKGQEIWPDGSQYQGEYKQGMKDGFGYYLWSNGSTYKGQWSKNMISGIGIQEWSDGRRYEGQFIENMMDGMGFYRFADGKTYLGFYQSDRKHGYGIFTWLDGKQYQGWWTQGKQDGYGILVKTQKMNEGDEEGKPVLSNVSFSVSVNASMNISEIGGVGDSLADEKIRYGIWKNGQKVRWLTQEEIKEMMSQSIEEEEGELISKLKESTKLVDSYSLPQKLGQILTTKLHNDFDNNIARRTFQRPAGFDKLALDIQRTINSFSQKQNLMKNASQA